MILQELLAQDKVTIITTIRELLKVEIDIDVYDSLTEELGIAFCGPIQLTEAGIEKFGDLLDFRVEITKNKYVFQALVDAQNTKEVRRLCELFESMAGYCSESDYNKWFQDANTNE